MTTPSHTLREAILETLSAAHPQPMRVQEIYSAVERIVAFDADDLVPPIVRGEPIAEPSWKRNIRNVLQDAKREGTLVNIAREAWRLPTPDPRLRLDEDRAWEEVRSAAEKALDHGVIYRSTKQEHRYRIKEAGSARIVIERLDSPAPEVLTAGEVQLAARYLNAAGGRVGRRTLSYTVAKEVTLVFLHPRLTWSEDNDWIEVVGVEANAGVGRPVYQGFGEAPDDDPAKLAQFARRVRRGQPKFRKNLLALYGGRCAISGWGPESVLEAAHILLHADSGLNHTDNGLLLRADLHSLFDDGLLRIDPSTLSVVLDPSLKPTAYWSLNGTPLRPRLDASHPSREYLRLRWEAGHDG
ncbi:MAG TPA: HNH endonuclease [Longimicrobium sp.]|nr:HNH endonuclease [Longimicrobium sp.]